MQNCKKTSQILRLTIIVIVIVIIVIIIITIIIIIIIITDSFPFHRAHRRS